MYPGERKCEGTISAPRALSIRERAWVRLAERWSGDWLRVAASRSDTVVGLVVRERVGVGVGGDSSTSSLEYNAVYDGRVLS